MSVKTIATLFVWFSFQVWGFVPTKNVFRSSIESKYRSCGVSLQLQRLLSTRSLWRLKSTRQDSDEVPQEYAALEPGTELKILVGDIALARKAWKKRRRSGSPLLVPCSVLEMERESMLIYNILYLVQRFGKSLDELQKVEMSGREVALSLADISQFYRKTFGSSINKHAQALKYESSHSLFTSLFNERVQEEYGLQIWQPGDNERSPVWLVLPQSRHRARSMASQAAHIQFKAPESVSNNLGESAFHMSHTGIVRVQDPTVKIGSKFAFSFSPLSAALRVSQRDVDEGRIEKGSIHNATVFSFDTAGDGGSPLLIMANSRSTPKLSERFQPSESRVKDPSKHVQATTTSEAIERDVVDLKVGDGPFTAKVINISPKNAAAFVDCNVGRKLGKHKGGGMTHILGMLRFDEIDRNDTPVIQRIVKKEEKSEIQQHDDELESASMDMIIGNEEDLASGEELTELLDMFGEQLSETDVKNLQEAMDNDSDSTRDEEIEGETEDDITHLFTTNDNAITYQDPETEESLVINDESTDLDADDLDDDDDDAHPFVGMTPQERFDALDRIMGDDVDDEQVVEMNEEAIESDSTSELNTVKTKRLREGDTLQVYVKSVSKQSGRFSVTTDPSVKGQKAKNIKHERQTEKKKARLLEKLGGKNAMERLEEMRGVECYGEVKATSNSGEWCYIQPIFRDLPVGVGVSQQDQDDSLSSGDVVRVRLEGIDENRGQLTMTVLERVGP